MVIVTRINSIDDSGIFTFGYSTALLFSYIGLYYGRVYQVSDTNNNDKDFFITKDITCILMMLVSLIFVIARGYNLYKCLIILGLCLFKAVEAYFDTLYAIFQKKGNIYIVGISLTLKSILGILAFLIMDLMTKNILLAITCLIVMNITIFIFYDKRKIHNYYDKKNKFNIENIKKILCDGFYPFLILFLTLYLVNASKYVIDFTLDDSFQTIFGIIIMPATVIVLIAQYMIQPYIITFTNNYQLKKYSELKKIIIRMIFIILFCGIFILVCAYLLGIPVLELVYGITLKKYKMELMIILVGAIFYGMATIFSNILMAIHKNKIQVLILLIVSIITFISSYYLVNSYQILGACLAYLLTMLILLVLFLVVIFQCIFKKQDGD